MEQFCEITLDRERLKCEVRTTYTKVAEAPGGWIQFADIVVDHELSEMARNDIDLWVG